MVFATHTCLSGYAANESASCWKVSAIVLRQAVKYQLYLVPEKYVIGGHDCLTLHNSDTYGFSRIHVPASKVHFTCFLATRAGVLLSLGLHLGGIHDGGICLGMLRQEISLVLSYPIQGLNLPHDGGRAR